MIENINMIVETILIYLGIVAIREVIEWMDNRGRLGTLMPQPINADALITENYKPDECDKLMHDKCTDLLNHEFPEPADLPLWSRVDHKMRGMDLEKRKKIMEELVYKAATAMQVKLDGISFEDVKGYGFYSAGDNRIVISKAYLEVDEEGVESIKTIFHELKHAVQYHAIAPNGNIWGYSQEILIAWANNFQCYIQPEIDPEGYFCQPVEVDAFGFECSLVPRLKTC